MLASNDLAELFAKWQQCAEEPRTIQTLCRKVHVESSVGGRLVSGQRPPTGRRSREDYEKMVAFLRRVLDELPAYDPAIPDPKGDSLDERLDHADYLHQRSRVIAIRDNPDATHALRDVCSQTRGAINSSRRYRLLNCRNLLAVLHLRLQCGHLDRRLSPIPQPLVEDLVAVCRLLWAACVDADDIDGDENARHEAFNYFGNGLYFAGVRLNDDKLRSEGIRHCRDSLESQVAGDDHLDDWQVNNLLDCLEHSLKSSPRKGTTWATACLGTIESIGDRELEIPFNRKERPEGYPMFVKLLKKRSPNMLHDRIRNLIKTGLSAVVLFLLASGTADAGGSIKQQPVGEQAATPVTASVLLEGGSVK